MASAQWHSRPPYKEAKVAPSGSSTADGPKANKWRVSDKDIPAHVTGAKLSSSEFDAQLSRIRKEDENAPPNLEAMSEEERIKAEQSAVRADLLFQQHLKRTREPEEVVLKRRREQASREIVQMRDALQKHPKLILPDSKFSAKWDVVTAIALIFTALVTPYEVALRPDTIETPLEVFWFVVNRVVDAIFVADMYFTFRTAFRKKLKEGWTIVEDFGEIQRTYLRGWFTVDFLSILPFWAIDVVGGMGNLSVFKLVRIVRLMRLLKLARMVRASRIFKRWEAKLSIPYSIIGLIKFGVTLLVAGHWMACAWCLIASVEPSYHVNWVDSLRLNWSFQRNWNSEECSEMDDDQFIDSGCNKPSGHQVYIAALYWALVTITSVGYGDITPKNSFEAGFATFFVLMGSCLWAYIIGNVCGIVATLDAETLNHQQTMDRLNYFMNSRQLPSELRQNLRMFFNVRKDIAKAENYSGLIDVMSPDLKGEVAYRHSDWLNRVPYMRGCSRKFLVQITEQLRAAVYIPKETITWRNSLSAVSRGVASWHDRVYTAGMYWGEDFILKELTLKRIKPAYAVTYIEVMSLSHEDLYDSLEGYPDETRQVRKALCRIAVHRGILWRAKQMLAHDRELLDLIEDKWKHKWESDVEETEKLVEEQKGNLNPDANLSSNANIRKQVTKLEKYVLELLIHHRGLAEDHNRSVAEAISTGKGSPLGTPQLRIQRLASYEPDLETPTPLSDISMAVENNQIKELRALLGKIPMYDPSLNDGARPPLHRAVISRNVPACSLLLRHGASLKTFDNSRQTPIQLSSSEGVDSIFFMLFEAHEQQKVPVDFDDLKLRANEKGHMYMVTAMEALSHIDD